MEEEEGEWRVEREEEQKGSHSAPARAVARAPPPRRPLCSSSCRQRGSSAHEDREMSLSSLLFDLSHPLFSYLILFSSGCSILHFSIIKAPLRRWCVCVCVVVMIGFRDSNPIPHAYLGLSHRCRSKVSSGNGYRQHSSVRVKRLLSQCFYGPATNCDAFYWDFL